MAAVPPRGDYFARARERINVDRLGDAVVVVFGLGSVGSQIVTQLARAGVASRSGLFVLYDGDRLEPENVGRHELGAECVGEHKVIGLKHHLMSLVPGITVRAVPEYVSPEMSDNTLLAGIADADLVVAATDDRDVQRRLGRLLVEADIPGVFPGVDPERGRGEVFIYLSELTPCYLCHDLHRAPDAAVRNVAALNVDMLPIVTAAASLCIGILDRESSYADEFHPRIGQSLPPTLFYVSRPTVYADGVFLLRGAGRTFEPSWPDRRPSCPGCAHLRQPPAPPRQQPPDPRQPPGRPRQPNGHQPAARTRAEAPGQATDSARVSAHSRIAGVAALLVVSLLLDPMEDDSPGR
jgi:molybdopterin/thiamine biosynthesis adenylyltransferase